MPKSGKPFRFSVRTADRDIFLNVSVSTVHGLAIAAFPFVQKRYICSFARTLLCSLCRLRMRASLRGGWQLFGKRLLAHARPPPPSDALVGDASDVHVVKSLGCKCMVYAKGVEARTIAHVASATCPFTNKGTAATAGGEHGFHAENLIQERCCERVNWSIPTTRACELRRRLATTSRRSQYPTTPAAKQQ